MNGKEKCNLIKSIRSQVAEHYGLEYHPAECHHHGDCAGTCPRCDAELEDLQRQLDAKGIHDIDVYEALREQVDGWKHDLLSRDYSQWEGEEMSQEKQDWMNCVNMTCIELNRLEGMPSHPEGIERVHVRERRKEFFKECPIAGWHFHDPEEFWDELYEGAELALVRQRNNSHDRNAVAVAFADDYDGNPEDFDFDYIIGYVPRTENEFIAKMMDLGWSDAFVAKLTTVKDHGAYADRLRMTIYLQGKAPGEPIEREDCLFAQMMDDGTFAEFKDELYRSGFYYCRWGYLLPDRDELPSVGDKVLYINRQDDETTMYLMHLMANGDRAVAPFGIPEERLEMTDDCLPCVLTNVKGPIVCASNDLPFLDDEVIRNNRPEGRLSKYATICIEEILNKH